MKETRANPLTSLLHDWIFPA